MKNLLIFLYGVFLSNLFQLKAMKGDIILCSDSNISQLPSELIYAILSKPLQDISKQGEINETIIQSFGYLAKISLVDRALAEYRHDLLVFFRNIFINKLGMDQNYTKDSLGYISFLSLKWLSYNFCHKCNPCLQKAKVLKIEINELIEKFTFKEKINLEDLFFRGINRKYLSLILFLVLNAEVNLNSVNQYGDNALIMATLSGDLSIVKILIKAGLQVNDKNNNDDTALHIASSNNEDLVNILLTHKAEVNVCNKMNRTPLMNAVLANKVRVAQVLLSTGANVNINSIDRKTALMIAVDWGNNDMVKFLLNNSIDINTNFRNRDGETALVIAERKQFTEIANLLKKFDVNNNSCWLY